MQNQTMRKHSSTRVVRLTARIWSIVSISLILLFIVGEGVNPASASEWIGFLFFPVGICAGMIIAWWKEGIGGSITIGSLAAFYVFHLATAGMFPKGVAWLAFAAPGFLFLLNWYRSRKENNAVD